MIKKTLLLAPILFLVACSNSQNKVISATEHDAAPQPLSVFRLTSPAFIEGSNIPTAYTCDSTNISPELHWTKAGGNVKSYVLIMDDPDAPMGTWVHWVVFNIPAKDSVLPASFAKDSSKANGIKQGITSFGSCGYGGPCPPSGVHRYFFKLFAVDTLFNAPCKSTGEKALIAAMKGHIMAETSLMGRYEKKKKQ